MPRRYFERYCYSFAVFCVALSTAGAADPTPEAALSDAISPVQKDVDYAKVAEGEISKCEVKSTKENGWVGWYVLGPNGEKLRRFADTDNNKSIDLWCYYQAGIEVYRDIDSDNNGKADQYRWLGTAGARWGVDRDEDGNIDTWKRISAEEVTQELVAAIVKKDQSRYASLLLTSDEVNSLNVSSEMKDKLKRKLASASADFSSFLGKQSSLTDESTWAHFVASQPGAIPNETSTDAEKDLLVYENVVAMFDTNGETGQLLVGTMVKVGRSWRLIDAPQIVAAEEGVAQNTGFFFQPEAMAQGGAIAQSGGMNADVQKLVAQLEEVEKKLSSSTLKSEKARLHDQQASILQSLIRSTKDPKEAVMWIRQMTESISAAIQGGEYPGGLAKLDGLRRSIPAGSKDLAAFVTFEYISADYGLKVMDPNADFAKIQEAKVKALKEFVAEYSQQEQSAKAMMDLALSAEFENNDREAIDWYRKVASGFSQSADASKAQGAIRRLDAIGKQIPLTGKTINGQSFSLAAYKGRPVIIHYWATWCETCKQDMKMFRKLQAQYARDRVTFIGINVDTIRSNATAYIKANDKVINWPQLWDEGGLESSKLATVLGVQTLPTTLVIDKQGRVAKTNVVATELEDEIKRIVR